MEGLAKHDVVSSDEYDLGDCILNAEHGELRSKKTYQVIHIEKKVAQAFACLAKAQGEVVTRDEIFAQVWPNVIASDDSLNRCISVLRKTFKTFGHGLAIQTHPKVGFNLVYPARCSIDAMKANKTPEASDTPTLSNTPLSVRTKRMTHYLPFSLAILLMLTIYLLLPTSTQEQSQASSLTQNSELPMSKLALLPFNIDPMLLTRYANTELSTRQSLSHLSFLSLLNNAEIPQLTSVSAINLGKQFDVNYVIYTDIYQQSGRDILSWRLIDSNTGLTLVEESLDLATHAINPKQFICDLVWQLSERMAKNPSQHIDMVLEAAKQLFQANESHVQQRPVLAMLARVLTEIDTRSLSTIKLLSLYLTESFKQQPQYNNAFVDLAIRTLEQAATFAPDDNDIMFMLAEIYTLKYQWQHAADIYQRPQLTQSEQLAREKAKFALVSGTYDSSTIDALNSVINQRPIPIDDVKLLIKLHMALQQYDQMINLVEQTPVPLNAWHASALDIAGIYLQRGKQHIGRALLTVGLLHHNVEAQYGEILLQGYFDPDSTKQAIDFLVKAYQQQKFSHEVMLYMFNILGQTDRFLSLANKLAKQGQFHLNSIYGVQLPLLLNDSRFNEISNELGLIDFWQKTRPTYFCHQTNALSVC